MCVPPSKDADSVAKVPQQEAPPLAGRGRCDTAASLSARGWARDLSPRGPRPPGRWDVCFYTQAEPQCPAASSTCFFMSELRLDLHGACSEVIPSMPQPPLGVSPPGLSGSPCSALFAHGAVSRCSSNNLSRSS